MLQKVQGSLEIQIAFPSQKIMKVYGHFTNFTFYYNKYWHKESLWWRSFRENILVRCRSNYYFIYLLHSVYKFLKQK